MTAPRYGTPRRPDRPTTGTAARKVAARLGITLMPWQCHALDVLGEQIPDPDVPGQWVHAYGTGSISVGRRGGKSTLVLVKLLTVAAGGRRRRAWYTAQSRGDAAVTMRDEWIPTIAPSPLGPYVKSRESNGTEALLLPARSSIIRLFAPTPTSLHGQDGDLIVFDEAWAHSAARGAELEIAARPTMATRPGAQQLIASAAGDADSTWWLDLLDSGRAAVAADTGTGRAHLEWTADAPGLDYDDPAVWLTSHPAARHAGNPAGTIPLAWLADEHERNRDQFVRNYLNVTDRTGSTASPIDVELWDTYAVPAPARGLVALGVECGADQASTSIVAAHHLGAGVVAVEVLDYRAGHGWAVPRIVDLYERHDVHTVALDPGGPAGALLAPLQMSGVHVTVAQLRDVTASAAQFVEAVRTGMVRHVPHPMLDAAVAGARRRNIGDGAWTWGRRDTDTDSSPVGAASLARWAHPDIYGTPAAIR